MSAPVHPGQLADPAAFSGVPADVLPVRHRKGLRLGFLLVTAVMGIGMLALLALWRSTSSPAAVPVGAARHILPPAVSLPGKTSGRVPWQTPLTVTSSDGTMIAVVGTDPFGAPLAGAFVDDHTWRASNALIPDARYQLTITVRDLGGRPHAIPLAAQTTPATAIVHAVISPGDGAVVGVGMPVIVTLDHVVDSKADRALVEQRLGVRSSPAQPGAWHWMSGSELHFRPASYWAAGTAITVSANMTRLHLSDGTWGSGRPTVNYQIGDSYVSTVDITAHTMTVTRNGVVLRVMKASMGRPGYPTYGGVHIVLEKSPSRIMDSTTTGHPKGTPDYYRETVYWTVRVSNGGAFVHSAPWSVQDQGVRNVSHGCINLSPANAQWYYGLAQRGDVVDVIHADAGPRTYDPGMSDWNMSFATWQSGSALV